MTNPKILIIGYGRGGKDTAAEYLSKRFGYTFSSSSAYVCKKLIYNALKDIANYTSEEECYKDRHSLRPLWYELICLYNRDNPSRLAENIISEYDIYVGMRDKDELKVCKEKKLFDYILWIDGVDRTGYVEDESSCNITQYDADFIIDNNKDEKYLYQQLDQLFSKGEYIA
jgi:hypothetical protein